MNDYRDLIPNGDLSFDTFQQGVVSASVLNQGPWNIPLSEITQLTTTQGMWTIAWNAAKNKFTRSHEDVVNKDAARGVYEPELRRFLQENIVRNVNISDGQRAAMGIQARDTHHTPIARPIIAPLVDIQSGVNNCKMIYFRTESGVPGKLKRGKPNGCAKITLAYVLDPENPPVTPKDCNLSESFGKTIKRLEHDPENAGKTVYFFACYENPKGERGPWTERQSVVLP